MAVHFDYPRKFEDFRQVYSHLYGLTEAMNTQLNSITADSFSPDLSRSVGLIEERHRESLRQDETLQSKIARTNRNAEELTDQAKAHADLVAEILRGENKELSDKTDAAVEGLQQSLTALSATLGEFTKSNAPHDLVTNGNFFAPINQRGQTSYTGIGYTIDRWQFLYTGGTAEVVNAGLKLTSNVTSGTTHLSQVLAPEYYWYYYARQLTLAVCMSNGSIQTKTGILTNGAIVTDDGYAMLEIPQGTSQMRLYLRNPNPGTSITFRWVAVYPGEYTTATLPIYTPKNRAAELAECQRYFFRLGGGYFPWAYGTVGAEDVMARATLHMPTTMRINPTVTIVGDASTIRIRGVSRFAPISSVTATTYPGKLGLFINLTMKLQEAGAFILYATDGSASLDFSADL